MVSSKSRNFGLVLLRFALGVFFIVSGIYALQGKGGEIGTAVRSILKGDIATIVTMALVICEILAGAFLLLSFFSFLGSAARIVLIIVMILWCAIIVFIDILGSGGLLGGALKSMPGILGFLKTFSSHLLVLGALLIVR